MEARHPDNEDRGNGHARAPWQEWVASLEEAGDTDTIGPCYEMRLKGRK